MLLLPGCFLVEGRCRAPIWRSRQSQSDSTSLSKSYGNPRAEARRECHWSWSDVAPPKILRCPPLHSDPQSECRSPQHVLQSACRSPAYLPDHGDLPCRCFGPDRGPPPLLNVKDGALPTCHLSNGWVGIHHRATDPEHIIKNEINTPLALSTALCVGAWLGV